MKKAFNFKKLLVCVLILVLCLSAFIACNDNDDDQEQPYDPNGINMAVNALKVNVKGRNVNADFTLDNHQVYASVSYPITWSVAITEGETSDVTLTVEGDKTVVHVNGKTETEVKFTLTARITDAQGVVKTVDIKYTIPAYKLLTHAEYMAAKAGDAVTVQGIVSHYGSKSNGASYNNLFMYDNDGSYYIYSIANSVDPANIQGFHLGAKVEISGTKDIYNGTHEVKDATIKVIDSTLTAQFEDITDIFKSATSVSDAALAAYEYRLVTIKNVTIDRIDDTEKHNYYFFKSGSLETYIRLSTSDCMLNKDQQAAFKAAFAADNGKLATVKGCVVLYNGQFYLNPVDTTPYTVVNTEGLTAQEQVNFAVDNTFVQSTVSGNGSSVTLPTTDSIFNDVKITWSVDKTDLCTIADGKATFTFLTDNTVKLTATFTHSTDASAKATKDFTIALKGAELITIAELYDKAVGDTAYYVEGYVVAVDKASDGKCSFVLQDATASIFSYSKLDVKLGDHIKVLATRSEDGYKFPQLGSISYEKLADGTFEPAVNEMAIADVKITKEDAPADLYTKKYWKITGATIVKGGYGYQGNINYVDASNSGTQVISLKLNAELEALAATLVGKTVNIYGYSRGINTKVGYFTVQANKLEEVVVEKTDEEKVANVKATLKDMEVSKDFDLPTSSLATITWAIKGETTAATLAGNKVTINQTDADQTVVFTATIVSGDERDTKDITVTIKAKSATESQADIVNKAYALEENGALDGTYTLTGVITAIKTPYDSSYGNITVIIVVDGLTEKPIECFRMKGTDADKLMVNDTITVTGTLKNFRGTVEFDAGCTFANKVTGTSTISVAAESSANATVIITDGLTSGENGKTFSFTVAVASGHELVSVKVNGVDVVATEGQYTCTINGNMVIVVETKAEGAADPVLVATFTLGDDGTAAHVDGSPKDSYTETVGDYTLNIGSVSKFYTGAKDNKGNGGLKLGTGSAAGGFTITVPTGVKKVVIYVAGYKTYQAKYTINGGTAMSTTKLSNNGEYDAVEITVPEDGKIVFSTASGGYRAMINTIEFYA